MVVVGMVLTIPRARSATSRIDTVIHTQGVLLVFGEIAGNSVGTGAGELSGEGFDTAGAKFGFA
jgi:hypothetical protein